MNRPEGDLGPLLDRVRFTIRSRHYSPSTEKSYLIWIRRFLRFHRGREPLALKEGEIVRFLSHLATDRRVSAATQSQALSAILFLYRHVFDVEMEWLQGITRARRPVRLPVVLTRDEVQRLLAHLDGMQWLMVSLLYGSGLRLMECLRLRVKDVDLSQRQITVRAGKGNKDRVTILPWSLTRPPAG